MKPVRGRVLVQKYGGSSVATPERLRAVAQLIKARRAEGFRICVVVSAMGDTTDELLRRASEVHPAPPRRELDMLLTSGERVSMALLSMALDMIGVPSMSFTGSQSGIITTDAHTDARIVEVRPFRVQDCLEQDRVAIVAGFQGVSYKKEITTLGRGGTDTTAVAMAAALGATSCEIYSDVDGVLTADPRVVPDAVRLDVLGYEEMQELAAAGARVLNPQAVQFAKAKGIALYCRQTGGDGEGTVIRVDAPPPPGAVRGIAHSKSFYSLAAKELGRAAALLAHLDGAGMPTVQILGRSPVGVAAGGLFVLVAKDDAHGAEACFATLPEGCERGPDLGAVSVVGSGLLEVRTPLLQGLRALEAGGFEVLGLSTSSFRATFFLDPARVEEATRLLHAELIGTARAAPIADESARADA